jgi:hypoxanthine-DNA glycosylase
VTHCLSFAPVSRSDAHVLILGSLPGVESLRRQQYYAKRQNAFWRIMADVVGADPEAPYEQRLERLKGAGLALWDVCASARREGSLDVNIRDMQPNDFVGFFRDHRHIALICFNGQTAAKLFARFVVPDLPDEAGKIARKILPSTSPAHAGMGFEQKLALWRAALTSPDSGSR